MAEEGTLGMARAHDTTGDDIARGDDASKQELQRRMEEARDSITQTVTEIKDSVVQQYESVKETISETLDWREQFKKRPVAWTAGAVGAGFIAGYGLAAIIKGDGNRSDRYEEDYGYAPRAPRTSAAQSLSSMAASYGQSSGIESEEEDEGPGILQRFQETAVFERLRAEAGAVGNHFVDEVSKTAKQVLLPAAIGAIRGWLEGLIPQKSSSAKSQQSQDGTGATQPSARSSYQPVLERSQ